MTLVLSFNSIIVGASSTEAGTVNQDDGVTMPRLPMEALALRYDGMPITSRGPSRSVDVGVIRERREVRIWLNRRKCN